MTADAKKTKELWCANGTSTGEYLSEYIYALEKVFFHNVTSKKENK